MNPAKDELTCQDCDRDYDIWYAPNRLWNQVVVDPTVHFLCPTCFMIMAARSSVLPLVPRWFFGPDTYLTQEVKEEFRKR